MGLNEVHLFELLCSLHRIFIQLQNFAILKAVYVLDQWRSLQFRNSYRSRYMTAIRVVRQ